MNRAVEELACDRGYDTRKCRNYKFAIQLAMEMQLVVQMEMQLVVQMEMQLVVQMEMQLVSKILNLLQVCKMRDLLA